MSPGSTLPWRSGSVVIGSFVLSVRLLIQGCEVGLGIAVVALPAVNGTVVTGMGIDTLGTLTLFCGGILMYG